MSETIHQTLSEAEQILPTNAYRSRQWFEQEQRQLFDQSWSFACPESELVEAGDFRTLHFMDHSLFVIRDAEGALRAFHNICRHRGCKVLEGQGNTGAAMVCPYHRWSYELDGRLRGVPNEKECFTEVPREQLGLKPAGVGVHAGLVYVNPSPSPADEFEAWIGGLAEHSWPHCPGTEGLEYSGSVTYEMGCNWKVFYENAVDGYHLGYLHDRTLGKVYPDKNVWKPAGRNVVWYSTERQGTADATTVLSAELADGMGAQRLPGHDTAPYPGVVMLFPLTILSPSPWGLYVSVLEPISPELTNMHTHSWSRSGEKGRFELPGTEAPVRLTDLDVHPLESGNFQIEDMWICEKIQQNMRSPEFQVGPLATGAGAESPITHFQRNVLEFLDR